ncbi:hypothetical protein B0H16DRAFT_1831582 [Mycena metata]|uniref:Uncharacterized protein n=1 Tax=Mycena metata TaxID=1033252 RepID=A0AAD7J360_9AGAR|nr:hypothetical protein B0H16DRAFT_1831582 [Mycena metata]
MQFLANNAPGLLTAVAPGQAPRPAAPNPAPTASQPALPPPSSQPSLPAQPAALPIQPYQSLRVAPSSLPARLTHSASSQPRQANLPRRRPRTNAVAPPSLPWAPDINSCLTLSGGQTHLRTMNIVYPPQIAGLESNLYLMRFLKDTFLAKMREFGLCVLQTSPTTQLVTEHISNIVHEFRNRGMDIVASDSTVLSHEDQPLSSLYLVNRGLPRPSDNQIRLRRLPLRPGTTMGEVGANRLQLALPGVCIETFEGVSYLALYWVLRQPILNAVFALPGPGQTARSHHCISQRLYTMFPRDRVREQWPLADGNSSCGESDDDLGLDDDADDDENLPPTPTPVVQTRAAQATARVLPPSPTVPEIPSLPTTMWDEPWQPNHPVIYNLFREASVYVAATNGTDSRESVDEAADELIAAVARCVNEGDFTSVLSDDQSAVIYRPGTRTILSSGDGVLREIFHKAQTKLLKTTGRQWLTPQADGNLSMLFIRSQGLGQHTFGPRQRMISTTAALWSLGIIKGFAPNTVDPCLIQFLLNECDFRSVHPLFMAEYHPVLKSVLDSWRSAGPQGNVNIPGIVSHSATYHDLEITAVAVRDQATHDGFFVEMAYRGVIGSEAPSHVDVVAAARGARLPCHNGWTFTKFIGSVRGGSDSIIANVMASVMGPETLSAPIAAAMGGESLINIIADYLMGSGIPCPAMFEEARQHFPAGVDLSFIDSPNFRAQMLTWAISGTPYLPKALGNIKIMLVDDNDTIYLGGRLHSLLPSMIASGTLSFRTCFLECRIPASFLLRAAQASYTSEEPRSRRQFIHHWLLCQSLNGIDNHTFA